MLPGRLGRGDGAGLAWGGGNTACAGAELPPEWLRVEPALGLGLGRAPQSRPTPG